MKRILTAAALLAVTVPTAQAQFVPPDWSGIPAKKTLQKANPIEDEARRTIELQREKERALQKQAEQAEANAQAAKRERQQRDQRSALEQAAAEAAQERARIAALPSNRLRTGYAAFAHVNWCHDVRDGYAYKYINDVELERAKTAVKAIVEQTTKEDTSINTDEIWQKALRIIAPYTNQRNAYGDQLEVCRDSLEMLFKLSPAQVYSVAKP